MNLKNMSAPSSQYLLLLLQPNTGPAPSPAELQEIMARFGVWMGELYARRIVVSTNGLEPAGKIVREPGGAVITALPSRGRGAPGEKARRLLSGIPNHGGSGQKASVRRPRGARGRKTV